MACRRAWTTDELAYLRRWAGRKGIERMHDELGRTKHAIEVQMSRMGVKNSLASRQSISDAGLFLRFRGVFVRAFRALRP